MADSKKKAIIYPTENGYGILFPDGATDEELKNIRIAIHTGFSFPIPPQCPEDFDKGGMSQPIIAE